MPPCLLHLAIAKQLILLVTAGFQEDFFFGFEIHNSTDVCSKFFTDNNNRELLLLLTKPQRLAPTVTTSSIIWTPLQLNFTSPPLLHFPFFQSFTLAGLSFLHSETKLNVTQRVETKIYGIKLQIALGPQRISEMNRKIYLVYFNASSSSF